MKCHCSKYDSYYSVQECIRFLLRTLYNYATNMEIDYNKIMNLFVGLPVYNLDAKLRKDLIFWCKGRNWPDKKVLGLNDPLKSTGYILGSWCLKMLDIFQVF